MDDARIKSAYSLDTPLKALIFYLCVKRALESGTLSVPSSHDLSAQLGTDKTLSDLRVKELWNDLKWMNQRGLLFRESLFPREDFFRGLSQPNVNSLIRQFRPGISRVREGQGYELVPGEFVEKVASAVRLVAIKDLFHATGGESTRKAVYEFMTDRVSLISKERPVFDAFIKSMRSIGYISLDKNEGTDETDDLVVLEPGPVLRRQDMYIELRALDYFKELHPKTGDGGDRLQRRLQIHSMAAKLRS